MVNREPQSLGL
jgi:hypothetical protein